MWPTPDAHMGTGGRTSKEFPTTHRPSGTKRQVTLNDAVKWWPTPLANDGQKRGDFDMMDPRNGLPAAVKRSLCSGHFATPTARDWRSGKASEATHARNSRPLSEQIGGSLNPTWVEWLMGYPLGWTDLNASETP